MWFLYGAAGIVSMTLGTSVIQQCLKEKNFFPKEMGIPLATLGFIVMVSGIGSCLYGLTLVRSFG